MKPLKMLNKKICFAHFMRPCDQGKRQHKDIKFFIWGPTTFWHNIESVDFYFSKSLHPNIHIGRGQVIFYFFAIFENVHIAADQAYFYKFSFSKNHRDLKIFFSIFNF